MGAGDTKIMSNTETIRMISVMEDSRAKKKKKKAEVSMHVLKKLI